MMHGIAKIANIALMAALGCAFAGPAAAAESAAKAATAVSTAHADQILTGGVVRKIGKDSGKITIKHDEIKNLGMPPMTMMFRVKDAALLDQLREGDAIRFYVEPINGINTVLRIEHVR